MKAKNIRPYLMQVVALVISVFILWCTPSVIVNGAQLWAISDEIHYLEEGNWSDEDHARYDELIEQRVEIRDSSWIGYALVQAGTTTLTSVIRDTFLFGWIVPLGISQLFIIESEILKGKSLDERIIIRIGRSRFTRFIRDVFLVFGFLPLACLAAYCIFSIIFSDIKHWRRRYKKNKPLRCRERCRKCSNTNCPARFRDLSKNRNPNVVSLRDYRKAMHR